MIFQNNRQTSCLHPPPNLPRKGGGTKILPSTFGRGAGVRVENLLRAGLKPLLKRHLKFIEYLHKAIFQSAEIVSMQT